MAVPARLYSSSRSTSLHSNSISNSTSNSISNSISNSSLSQEDDSFRTEEPNSFNSTILQKDVTSQCRIGASSSKSGHSVDNLRVNRLEDVSKLWQSDGSTPHFLTIELERQTALSELRFYIDYRSDESYTPRTVIVQLGSSIDLMTDFTTISCEGSQGWVCVDLGGSLLRDGIEFNDFIKCSIVRLVITSNCQLGRDSRIRGIRLFSPILPSSHYRQHDQYIQKHFIIS